MHEFAVTIAAAILVSGVVSVTLTPMLCSRFLKPPHETTHGAMFRATERMFDLVLAGLRVDAAAHAAIPPRGHGRVDRARRRHVRPVHDGADRVHPERGYGPDSSPDRGRAGHRLRGDAAAPVRGHRDRGRRSQRRVGGGHDPGRQSGPAVHRAQAARGARAERRPGDRGAAAQAGAGPRLPRVPAEPAADSHRRAEHAQPLPVDAAESRHQGAVRGGAEVRGAASPDPGPAGRDERPADQEPADQRRVRPRPDRPARALRGRRAGRPQQRLRHAPGLDHLRSHQSVRGDHAGRAGIPAEPGGVVDAPPARPRRTTGAALRRGDIEAGGGPAAGEPRRAVAVGHALLQPAARCRARRRGGGRGGRRPRFAAGHRRSPASRARRRPSSRRCRAWASCC